MWSWLGPISRWLDTEIRWLAKLVRPYMEEVERDHPDYSDEQKRQYVVARVLEFIATRKLTAVKVEDILVAIRIAYRLWKKAGK